MIVDPSDIVGRNRRQENSNAMLSEGEEVNMGMVGIDSIHVEPEWCSGGVSQLQKAKKQKNRASSRQTRTHDGSGTPKKYVCVCTRCMVTNSFICIVHPILEVYLWYTYTYTTCCIRTAQTPSSFS